MPVRENTPERAGLRSAHPVSRPHLCVEARESAGLFARGIAVHWRDGLAAGGSRIRTRGPSAKGKAMGCHSRQALPSLDLNLLVAPPLVRPSPIGNAQKSLSQERDRWFESGSLQRRVCEPISLSCSVPSVDGSSLPSRAPRNAGPTADRRAKRAVSDEMVLTLSATGTADDVAARISALLKAGLKQAVLFPLAVDGDASGAIVRTIEALS